MSAPKNERSISLKAAEAEVLAEGQEWMRQRLQQKLQAQAEQAGALFSPPATAIPPPDPAHRRGGRDGHGALRTGASDR